MRSVNVPRSVRLSFSLAALAAAACATEARGPRDAAVPPAVAGRPPVAVTVAAATRHEVVDAIEVVGSLAPKFSADVKSEVTAVVAAVFVTEWAPVRAGQPLARLDATEAEAVLATVQAARAQAAVGEQRARREHARARQLLDYGLITPQAADEAASALDASTAAVRAADAQVRTAEARLTRFLINAPMDGVVALRRVNVGDRVENMGGSEPMFRIVDTRLLELTVSVPSIHVGAVRVGQPIAFATDSLPGRTFDGRVMFINPAVDEASRSARVVAEVPNGDGSLKGGLFARGRIVLASRPDAVLVPREALLEWNVAARTASVFVVEGDCAGKRAVRTGAVTADGVEIVDGLAAGAPVVTRGGFALRPGDQVRPSAPSGAAIE
jgi:membrane fusion protein, multidrug efflux system